MPLPPFFIEHPKKDNWLSVARVRAAVEAETRGAASVSFEGDDHIF
jgi:hypothetical protein